MYIVCTAMANKLCTLFVRQWQISYVHCLYSLAFMDHASMHNWCPLRKHAYSNILKILAPKNENFQIKNPDIFYTSAQNIDCGYLLEPPRRGDSNEYPQSMF